jgi:flagellar hook-basal body complex protein FliE
MNPVGGVSDVLAQIRAIRGQTTNWVPESGISGLTPNSKPESGISGLTPNSFTSALTKAVNTVSQTQDKANGLADAFERGDRNTSIAQVMLSMQKAQVEFKALAEVRNRLVQAYQDIQNMPL